MYSLYADMPLSSNEEIVNKIIFLFMYISLFICQTKILKPKEEKTGIEESYQAL